VTRRDYPKSFPLASASLVIACSPQPMDNLTRILSTETKAPTIAFSRAERCSSVTSALPDRAGSASQSRIVVHGDSGQRIMILN
jgi:hypothetical protein